MQRVLCSSRRLLWFISYPDLAGSICYSVSQNISHCLSTASVSSDNERLLNTACSDPNSVFSLSLLLKSQTQTDSSTRSEQGLQEEKQESHRCSKVNGKEMIDLKSRFVEVYSVLKSELLHDPSFEWDDASRKWVERMLDYNVPGGKLNRGLSVVDSCKLLKGRELTDDEFFLSSAVGWCIEWLQAYFLVLDDIMDSSHTRRGQPCWFRVPQVGMIAVNDGLILRNHITGILKNHFRGKPYYADLLDLFSEVEFQTTCGQMTDLITTIEGEKDLTNYSLDVHRRIVQYKTAYYSFYLPVACALVLTGEKLENHVDVKNILVDMGIYFQVQDDFLDCFGDPAFIGKIGTDIEDFKCSWLVVKALEVCNKEQKSLLLENYGKQDSACVAIVKELYNELNLKDIFEDYEGKSYKKLNDAIESHPNNGIKKVLRSFLGKIYRRQK